MSLEELHCVFLELPHSVIHVFTHQPDMDQPNTSLRLDHELEVLGGGECADDTQLVSICNLTTGSQLIPLL